MLLSCCKSDMDQRWKQVEVVENINVEKQNVEVTLKQRLFPCVDQRPTMTLKQGLYCNVETMFAFQRWNSGCSSTLIPFAKSKVNST